MKPPQGDFVAVMFDVAGRTIEELEEAASVRLAALFDDRLHRFADVRWVLESIEPDRSTPICAGGESAWVAHVRAAYTRLP